MNTMTLTQSAVLHFMRDFSLREGSMPTSAEIAKHFHWSSRNSAVDHLEALTRKGLLDHVAGRARGTRFTPRAWEILNLSTPSERPQLYLALPVIRQDDLLHALHGRAG